MARADDGEASGDEGDPLAEKDDPLAAIGAPTDRPRETLDAATLPPPQPLQRTLERLANLADEAVLIQYNDRAPQHLYPKLDDRGYEYATTETDEAVVTAIWRP